jgi:hypothetical protein
MTADELKAKIRKLSMRATDSKMALHDLSEELPTDWRKIPEVAQAAFDAHAELDAARKALKALETA